MRKSTITVTANAREVFPSLPDGDSLQGWKNWILEKVRDTHPDALEEATEGASKVIDFAPDHYRPLGLQMLIFRSQGLNVTVAKQGEYA